MSHLSESGLLDALEDAFFGFDDGGELVVWNRAATAATGYDESALSGTAFADLFEAPDVAGGVDAETLRNDDRRVVDIELVTATGERRPYEFSSHRLPADHPVAFAGLARDVSERRDQHEQTESRERVLREMYEIIADRSRSFTEQVEALLSLGREELGTAYGTLSRIEGEEYVFEVVDADDDAIQAGDVVPLSATNCELAASNEQTLVLGDITRDAPEEMDRAGYQEWGISCYIGAPVFVESDVYGTFCFYDTTPRKDQFSDWEVTLVDLMSRWVSYELARERANERLETQNERLERFASIVSHDLRNPLSVADGSLQLARETGEDEHLDRVQSALTRMDALIDDLLTLARAGEAIGETETIDLAGFCEQCWGELSLVDATLVVETDRTVQADRTRLQQLLENLFNNAVQHGGDGVTVRVGDLANGFYVADDGPGIPPEDRETVFERGYSTDSEGSGFGLDIVAEIASAHGWNVVVTESESGGACFEVTGVD